MLKALTIASATILGAAFVAGPASALPVNSGLGAGSSQIETVQYGYGPRQGYGRPYSAPRPAVRPQRIIRNLLGVPPRRAYRPGGYGRPAYGRPGYGPRY